MTLARVFTDRQPGLEPRPEPPTDGGTVTMLQLKVLDVARYERGAARNNVDRDMLLFALDEIEGQAQLLRARFSKPVAVQL